MCAGAQSLLQLRLVEITTRLHLQLLFFMRFRRLTSLLSGICALSFTLGLGNVSCKNTSPTDSGGKSAATSEHSGMNQQSGGDQTHQKPCESSAVVCCQAMTSCGLSVSLGQTTPRGAWAPADAGALPSLVQVAVNFVIPPEPPPPKA